MTTTNEALSVQLKWTNDNIKILQAQNEALIASIDELTQKVDSIVGVFESVSSMFGSTGGPPGLNMLLGGK